MDVWGIVLNANQNKEKMKEELLSRAKRWVERMERRKGRKGGSSAKSDVEDEDTAIERAARERPVATSVVGTGGIVNKAKEVKSDSVVPASKDKDKDKKEKKDKKKGGSHSKEKKDKKEKKSMGRKLMDLTKRSTRGGGSKTSVDSKQAIEERKKTDGVKRTLAFADGGADDEGEDQQGGGEGRLASSVSRGSEGKRGHARSSSKDETKKSQSAGDIATVQRRAAKLERNGSYFLPPSALDKISDQ
jgi:hypothetical protein